MVKQKKEFKRLTIIRKADKEFNKDFTKLQKENDRLRKKIDKNLKSYMPSDEYEDTSYWINELIENELSQEEFCNQ